MRHVKGFSYQEILNLRYHISIYNLNKKIRDYIQNIIQNNLKGFSIGPALWSLMNWGNGDEHN